MSWFNEDRPRLLTQTLARQERVERIRAQPPRTVKLTAWLNVPRYPPFDRWGVPRGPIKVTKETYWQTLARVFDFSMPATYWFLAKRYAGKSTGAECVGIEYIECANEESEGGTVIDFYSSDDDEGAAWARSNYWPILFVCGNKVDLEYDKKRYPKLDWCHIGELKYDTPEQLEATMHKLESYKVVVTVPSFYYNPNEMFKSLSTMIEILKRRGKTEWKRKGKRKIICLIVREAKILLASRYWAGAVASRQDAEYDLIDLNDGAYHRGIAISFDALRFTSITPEVRDIADFTFLKRLGRTKIPREFNYLLRFTRPRYLRRMPKGEFVLYTDSDDIYSGMNSLIPWHVERGEGPLRKLGIKAVPRADAARPETPEGELPQTTLPEIAASELSQMKWKVSLEVHRRIVKLIIDEGLSFEKARVRLLEGGDGKAPIKLAVGTLHNEIKAHRAKVCIEVIQTPRKEKDEEGPALTGKITPKDQRYPDVGEL